MKKFLIYLLLSIAFIELGGYALALTGIEPSGFKVYFNNSWKNEKNAYADIDTLVGVWHQPNDRWIKSGPCYTVEMQSNQYGATDNVWDTTQKGYLFLGNSFIEGFGVAYGERVSEHFEKLAQKEVFNCGMSGTFSLVQGYMALKKFERTLQFDTCFVFITLPTDERLITKIENDRYRPYLNDTGIVFTKSQKAYPEYKSSKNKASLALSQFSYTSHLYDFFHERNHLKSALLETKKKKEHNNYTNIKRIISMFSADYPDKHFIFVLTPSLSTNSDPFIVNNKSNFDVIDLRNCLNNRTDYLICNPHWNFSGHSKFANALYQGIKRTL